VLDVLDVRVFETGFMVFGFVLQVLIVAAAIGIFWYWRNKATSEPPSGARSKLAKQRFFRLLSSGIGLPCRTQFLGGCAA
jgi:hypothetical protein